MREVVIGAGPVGSATARMLADQGHEVKVVTRSGRGPEHPGIERLAVDASDRDALARVTTGADVLYNCANPPSYDQWTRVWPPLAASILAAAEAAGAGLVVVGNLYGHGPVAGTINEDTPLAATTVKGRLRAQMWNEALAAQRAGRVRVTEARASDYFGPGVTATAHLGERVVPRVLAGKCIRVFGDPDVPHSWTYVPDISRALCVLGADERAWGRPWVVPNTESRSARQMIEAMGKAAGVPTPRVAGVPSWVVRAGGLASPLFRELAELSYQFDRPFTVDSSAFTRTFGVQPTPLEESIPTTVAWWRSTTRKAVA
jgi:nucleoside-diphosphate-sugar epimerase